MTPTYSLPCVPTGVANPNLNTAAEQEGKKSAQATDHIRSHSYNSKHSVIFRGQPSRLLRTNNKLHSLFPQYIHPRGRLCFRSFSFSALPSTCYIRREPLVSTAAKPAPLTPLLLHTILSTYKHNPPRVKYNRVQSVQKAAAVVARRRCGGSIDHPPCTTYVIMPVPRTPFKRFRFRSVAISALAVIWPRQAARARADVAWYGEDNSRDGWQGSSGPARWLGRTLTQRQNRVSGRRQNKRVA